MREDYFSPVGFAKEPIEVRRRRVGRVFTLLVAAFIAWMMWNRVIKPPTQVPNVPSGQETVLPGPR